MTAGLFSDAALAILRDYRDRAGSQDELLTASGDLRAVWKPFVAHLARLKQSGVALRFERGDRYLQDAGVYYRKYDSGDAAERAWPLSHIPVLMDAGEWQVISNGLRQRADLLEDLCADIYGPNRLVSDGVLPASLIAQNRAWLRPLVGTHPRAGHFLNFLAFEIGRGPDGKWWVLGDRSEAPSGAGFALENRAATSRMFPNFYTGSNITNLHGFFQDFGSDLAAQRGESGGQIAILTPGPMNDSYFEHAFVARHLGLLLAQGEDLSVRNGQVLVRTVNGPKPVSVLWRRQDASSCDPIELDEDSQLGTPGLVDAVRQGGVSIVNALGSGILETRALMAFMPRISRRLHARPLELPNIATWWCGQAQAQAHVLANRDRMMIGSAYSTRLPFDSSDGMRLGSEFAHPDETLERRLSQNGGDLVGQEAVTLSTTPIWHDGALEPRPMILRVFLARTASGWQVMPGGYARIGSGFDTKAIAMQSGGGVADVWVVNPSNAPNQAPARASAPAPVERSQQTWGEALPSRAADNLYWLGRYVERAEGNIRLFRAYHARLAEGVKPDRALLRDLRAVLGTHNDGSTGAMARSFSTPLENALASASQVRDRFSVDGMMALRDLVKTTRHLSADRMGTEEIPNRASIILRKITGFSGLVHENMYRSTGWRFLSLGVSLERAANTASILAALARADAPIGALELLLEVGDSSMSYRMRYAGGANHRDVADLLALDGNNPRAILYHLSRAKRHIDDLPGCAEHGRMDAPARLALQLQTRLAVETPQTLAPSKLTALRKDIWRLSDLLTAAYLV